jgi:hypothetical protein
LESQPKLSFNEEIHHSDSGEDENQAHLDEDEDYNVQQLDEDEEEEEEKEDQQSDSNNYVTQRSDIQYTTET